MKVEGSALLTIRPPVLSSGSNHFSRSWLFGAVAPWIYYYYYYYFVKDQIYRTPAYDLSDLEEIIYATINNVATQILHSTWVKVEYRLDIFLITNGSYVEVYVT